MSYALGLGGRPPCARRDPRLLRVRARGRELGARPGRAPGAARRSIAHGRQDPIIGVEFGRRARETLEQGGAEVEYHETDVAHAIDPAVIPAVVDWLSAR
ncbi:MAG: hypothetical protein WKF40_04340 [Thermoleophilaceae bacterium]